MIIILYIVLMTFIIYYGSLIIYFIGNIKNIPQLLSNQNMNISVIIAIKNGAISLPNLLSDLQQQEYKGVMEFILVDDESEDESAKIIKEMNENDQRFIYCHSSSGKKHLSFKKKALDAGIIASTHNLLLFTDVDCRLNRKWVSSMAQCFEQNIDYVFGFTGITKPSNLVAVFQKIDFQMLFTAARSMSLFNLPWASSGQNQAYLKETYLNIGFEKLQHLLQGDDSLFMQICKNNGSCIRFNNSRESYVESRQETNMWSFIKQRIRWAGDARVMWKYNKMFFITIVSTFITNLVIAILLFLFLLGEGGLLPLLACILITKFLLELLLYLEGSIIFKRTIYPIGFIMWFMLQIPYVVITGIGSFYANHISWRGKK